MITTTLVALLGLLLAVVLWKLMQPGSRPAIGSGPAVPARVQQDLANLKITQAIIGDSLSITGAGDEFADLDFTVDRRDRYQSGQRFWFELSGQYRNRRVFVTVKDEDDVRVIKDGKAITLDTLGITEEDLAALDERQNPADHFEFDGKNWMYRFSREHQFFPDGAGAGQGIYTWEFQEQDGRQFITVEKWEGEPFRGARSQQVNAGDVTVFRRA